MSPDVGIEPPLNGDCVTLHTTNGNNLVLPPGYDPGSSDFQSVAMTTSAKAAL